MKNATLGAMAAGVFFVVLCGPGAAADKLNCYNHHNCPNDGIFSTNVTKRQCVNLKGIAWGDGPKGGNNNHNICENLR